MAAISQFNSDTGPNQSWCFAPGRRHSPSRPWAKQAGHAVFGKIEIGGESMKLHNHFAGLLEMILPLSLSLAFYHWQSTRRRHRRRTLRSILENLGEPAILKCVLLLLAATVLLVAIVFSFSRMGMISMLVSLGMMAAVVWTGRRRSPL